MSKVLLTRFFIGIFCLCIIVQTASAAYLQPGAPLQATVIPEQNKRYVLSLRAHIPWSELAGASYDLSVTVNNVSLDKYALINKGQIDHYPNNSYKYQFTYNDGRRYLWQDPSTLNWAVFYRYCCLPQDSNNFTSTRYGVYGGEAYKYEFDITNYLIPGIENTITFRTSWGNNSNNVISIGRVELWKEIISSAYESRLGYNEQRPTLYNITDSSKEHFVRVYARNHYSKLAGYTNSLRVSIDGVGLGRDLIRNKPTNPNAVNNTAYYHKIFPRDDGGAFYYGNFSYMVPYSPNYYSNNVAGGRYGVYGGEAYKWDFNHPSGTNTVGLHNLNITNLRSGVSLMVRDIQVFEVTPLILN